RSKIFLSKKVAAPSVPIYLFCYHKVGTILLAKIFREICTTFGWRFKTVIGLAENVPEDADIILFMHSLIDLDSVDIPYIGAHFIRDPRDVIVSGYLYHKRCNEEWCINDQFDFTEPILFPNLPWSQQHRSEKWKREYLNLLKGKSYQQILRDKSERDGLLFELNNYGSWTVESMLHWDYDNSRIKEIQFEALINTFDDTFREMFEFFGFSEKQIKHCLRIAAKEDLNRKTKRQLRKDPHISPGGVTKWYGYFKQVHKDKTEEEENNEINKNW
ncbi:MAG: hypothetical protein D3910_26190, partial [Candidatus Electrothrix sp. ATG2]|nr:hypothetical protein [Candidatus Electrothrix sp. ATG2]